MTENFEDKTDEVEILNHSESIAGIPWSIALGLILFFGAFAVMVSFWIGGVLAGLSVFGLYKLHENDPQAAFVWIDRVQSQVRRYRAGQSKARRIVVLKQERHL